MTWVLGLDTSNYPFKILNFITYLMWLLPYKLIHSQVLVIKTKTSWEVILPTRKANYQNGYPKK